MKLAITALAVACFSLGMSVVDFIYTFFIRREVN